MGVGQPVDLAPLKTAAERVRQYGIEHGHAALTTAEAACSEQSVWEFTALADLLLDAQGGSPARSGRLGCS